MPGSPHKRQRAAAAHDVCAWHAVHAGPAASAGRPPAGGRCAGFTSRNSRQLQRAGTVLRQHRALPNMHMPLQPPAAAVLPGRVSTASGRTSTAGARHVPSRFSSFTSPAALPCFSQAACSASARLPYLVILSRCAGACRPGGVHGSGICRQLANPPAAKGRRRQGAMAGDLQRRSSDLQHSCLPSVPVKRSKGRRSGRQASKAAFWRQLDRWGFAAGQDDQCAPTPAQTRACKSAA